MESFLVATIDKEVVLTLNDLKEGKYYLLVKSEYVKSKNYATFPIVVREVDYDEQRPEIKVEKLVSDEQLRRGYYNLKLTVSDVPPGLEYQIVLERNEYCDELSWKNGECEKVGEMYWKRVEKSWKVWEEGSSIEGSLVGKDSGSYRIYFMFYWVKSPSIIIPLSLIHI